MSAPTLVAPPTFQSLLSGVDEAIATISSILEDSQQVKAEYTEQWTSILNTYERDVTEFNDILDQLSASPNQSSEGASERKVKAKKKKKRGAGAKVPNPNRSQHNNHALNFHNQLNSKKDDYDGDDDNDDEIFMLPPPSSDDELDSNDPFHDDESHTSQSPTIQSTRRNLRHRQHGDTHYSIEERKKREQQLKFNARENMLGKLHDMREYELDIERRLKERGWDKEGDQTNGGDNCGDDDGSSLVERTNSERMELLSALNQCQQEQSQHIVSLISSYKPRVGGSAVPSKRSKLGKGRTPSLTYLPPIEAMLHDAENMNTARKKYDDQQITRTRTRAAARNMPSTRRKMKQELPSLIQMSTQLDSNKKGRNDRGLCARLMKDPEQFKNIENLPYRQITTASSLRELVTTTALNNVPHEYTGISSNTCTNDDSVSGEESHTSSKLEERHYELDEDFED